MKSFSALYINPWIVLQTEKDCRGSLHLHTWQINAETDMKGRPCGDSLIPVGLGVAVEGREHDGQDLGGVVTDQTHDVLIVPVVKSSFCHLTK